MEVGNAVALAMLRLWIPLSVVVFFLFRDRRVAATALYVVGILVLPCMAWIDYFGLPPLTRQSAAVVAVTVGLLVRGFDFRPFLRPSSAPAWLFLLLLAGCALTVWTNGEPALGGRPGLETRDIVSMASEDVLGTGLPFLLGAALYRDARGLRTLFLVLVWCGLAYSVLALWEIRMSPQLHRMLYGIHQHSFAQAKRFGGWRPLVFLPHGLALSLFLATTAIAAAALRGTGSRGVSANAGWIATYFAGVVLLTKSVAAIGYTIVALGGQFLGERAVATIVKALCLLLVAYPLLCGAFTFPRELALDLTQQLVPSKVGSVETRLENESAILARALEKPLFGWGEKARYRIYDEHTLTDVSTTDGFWVIQLGKRGVLGFVAVMGMLLLPALAAARRGPWLKDAEGRQYVLALALIVAIGTIDFLPNGWFTSLLPFYAGALHGALRGETARARP